MAEMVRGSSARYRGRAELMSSTGRSVASGMVELTAVDDEVALRWKGIMTLEELSDLSLLEGKLGDHYRLRLLGYPNEPTLNAVLRHVDRMKLHLAGVESLPEPTSPSDPRP